MSLYGGIKFNIAGSSGSGKDETNQAHSPSGSASGSSTPAPGTGTGADGNGKPGPAKSTGEWSAALKFAPRVNKPKPTAASTSSTNNNGASTSASGFRPAGFAPVSSTSSSLSPGPGPSPGPSADIVRSAEPILKTVNVSTPGATKSTTTAEDEVQFGPDGLPLARAPAMTLNAANKGSVAGKRGKAGDGQKKKKKKKRKIPQQLMPTFDPDEQYDPNRPNDLGEYQQYRKRLREERRAKLLEEKRRRAQGLSSEESSYYTDSEEEAPRRDAPKMFAPPKMYSESSNKPSQPPTNFYPPPPSISAPPPPLPSSASGDDAYARRAALSQPQFQPVSQAQPQPSSGDDAYARRAAMSQPASGDDAYARRVAMSQPQASSGDDAYARRVAMSQNQGQAPSITPPSFMPTNARPASLYPFAPAAQAGPSGTPGFAPPSSAVPPSTSETGASATAGGEESGSQDFTQMLEERRKAAEAIAAKFKALAGAAPPPGPSSTSEADTQTPAQTVGEDAGGGSFAEKMMRKWGHKEGQGLGVRGEGIVHALSAEHVVAAPKPGETLTKRQLAKQKAATANAKNRKWVQNANSRGRIVNANDDSRIAEEKGRLGEASRVICLVGLVEGVEDVDEELSDEIGEECSKYGIVERVVLHMVEPPPPEPSDCLRVFIVFSGMAGAWRATKELDGRFFGGRKIRATYFDEARFDGGDRDGSLL
ncbi:hypothetical protein I316_01367 [Kwoniella heveanensis BCC8398]|uniref:G-patch domain-containing protein n=1 Tax=Kwoniella heveanensis BCC8398 TaxID=1296120 RepID=A0A1B9H0H5_9TREE|nr:hypothetical protein I316_01367 [Kwoniella heveanensis BCC8398]